MISRPKTTCVFRALLCLLLLLIGKTVLCQSAPGRTDTTPVRLPLSVLIDSAMRTGTVTIVPNKNVDLDLMVLVHPNVPLDSTLRSLANIPGLKLTWRGRNLSIESTLPPQ